MAVHDSKKDQSQSKQQAGGQQQQGGYGQQQNAGLGAGPAPGGQPHQNPGMGNINRMFGRSGSYDRSESRSAEALQALREIEKRAVESQGLSDDFEMIRFDRDDHRVGLSSILVTKTIKANGVTWMAVRALILDSEGIRLPPRIAEIGNQRIEVPTRPQDVFNDTYWRRVDEFLKRQKGIADMRVVDAGPLVVPADFDFKDEILTSRLLIKSVNHCDDIIATVQGEEPFSVSAVKSQNERLTARIDFTAEPTHDIVGHPVRSDILVTMNRQNNQQQQGAEQDFYERETEFNRVAGFVNLEYSAPTPQQQMPNWGSQPQQPQQLFTPTFVITSVDQADWIQAQTAELYLLAISNAYRVTAGTQWVKTFLPSVGKGGPDMRDIGALGYLTPAGKAIETKSDNFSDQDFVELMTALVRPNPTFLMDIDPVGDKAAIESYFIDAAFEGPRREAAVNKLVRAANNLTGNRFSHHFDPTQSAIVVPYGQEVHLGYYKDEEDEKRDIRDLDTLAMLNLTGGNVQDFMDWYRTMCDTTMPDALRMQRREQFERQFLSKGLKITGRALRVLLTPQFIEALDAATREAGVHVDLENVTSVMGGQRFTGNTMVGNYAVTRNAQMGYGPSASSTTGPAYSGVTGSGRLY